jgi:RNA polymerase sigma-70 factor (ECF subfamily)
MERTLAMPQTMICEERMSELGDIDALVVRYRSQVLRLVAYSLDDPDEAASITQDCFLKVYATRNQFRGQCAVSTWLLQIAFNLMRDHVRKRKFQFWKRARTRFVDVSEVAGRLPSGESSSESQLLARERVRQVQTALANLSPRQRSVFVLRFIEEMELPEIALATGMNLATVKTHLYRALEEVRSRVGEGGKGAQA